MGTLRIRLEFDDPQVLSEAQVSEGLRQSWVQLKPEHEIIFDVSSYIIHIFDLHESCPDGIVLSIDGFVLPPFESTYIIKDKDVVRIGRKRDTSSERVGNLIEEEVTEKLPSPTRLQLSAGDDFEKDAGTETCELEANEDNLANDESLVGKLSDEHTIVRKRKASRELQSSKKKRKRVVPEHLETEILTELNDSCREEKSTDKKKKTSDRKKKSNKKNTATRKKRSTKPEGTDGECVNPSDVPDGIKEVLSILVRSRGSKRKSGKKKWWQELPQAQREELRAAKLQRRRMRFPRIEVPNNSVEHLEEDSEGEGELVPVVTRPGHFRFRRLKKSEPVQQTQNSTETNHWNGSTSKSGQEQGNGIKRSTNVIDFDKLAPFTRLPKKGDVIAYRLLELNSTWTPELSPFRVGKTSWYNPQSHKLLLRPVPGHPIYFKKKADEDECAQRSNSLYNEDRSLVIKFSSLIDVRLVKAGESDPENAVKGWFSDMSIGNGGTTSTISESSMDKQAQVVSPEGEANPWDRIAQTVSAGKPATNDWEPWGSTSSRMQSVNAWMNTSSGTQPGGIGRGYSGSRPQPGIGWSKASPGKQSGYGRGNTGFRTQPAIGWSKANADKQPGNGWGNAGPRTEPANSWRNGGSGTQPGSGWSKPSSSTPPGKGRGRGGSGTQPANGWGNAGSGTAPWGRGGSGTQPGNGSGTAGPGTYPGKGWSKPSSSTPPGKGWGNTGSGTPPTNGWGNTGSGTVPPAKSWGNSGSGAAPPAKTWGNSGPGTAPPAKTWGNSGSGAAPPANGWSKGGSGTEPGKDSGNAGPAGSGTPPANGWGSSGPGTAPPAKTWGSSGSGAALPANGWGNAGSGAAPPANGWGNAGSGAAPPANGWRQGGSGTQPGNDSGNAGSGTQPGSGWSKPSSSAPPGKGWGNAGSGTPPANGWGNTGSATAPPASGWSRPGSSTQLGPGAQPANGGSNPSSSAPSGNGWGNAGSGTQPGNGGSGTAPASGGWSKPSTGTGKWSGKG